MKKILGLVILMSLMIPSLSFVRAEEDDSSEATNTTEQIREAEKDRLEQLRENEKQSIEQQRESNKQKLEQILEWQKNRIENKLERASTTEKRLENREENIQRIRERIASTTASTSEKRLSKLNDNLAKQVEKINEVKDRLLNKEVKVADVLGKIADKILARINILAGRGLDMTASRAKLAEAAVKIENLTVETAKLTSLIETEITDANKDQLFIDIKASQETIKDLARTTHALLVDTIKEITKVLPAKPIKTSTTTATTTN